MNLRLGKLAPVFDRRDRLFSHYIDRSKLPEIPEQFGHEPIIDDWRMLANDRAGCCVFSGGAHETMLLSAIGGNGMVFNDDGVLADYAAVTGYNPENPATDQGTLTRDAMNYRRQTGLIDFSGKRHKILAYVALEPGNIDDLKAAMYIFGAVGIGIQFPNSAMAQFDEGDPWEVAAGATTDGGHYVPLVGKRQNFISVTWGKAQEVTERFLKTYTDEAWAFVSEEFLQTGRTPEGFALDDLMSDLALLSK